MDLPLALPSLLSLLNLLFKFILICVADHKLDAEVTVVLIPGDVPGHHDPLTVTVYAMGRRDSWIEYMRTRTQTRHIVPVWETTTWHVTRIALQGSTLTVILVIVRVMNGARFDPSRPPTERRVTLCTVHLVTPIYFENHRGALRAVARILGQELGRLDAIWVARMRAVLAKQLDLVAIWAGPVVAHAALPRTAQKPAAIGNGTRPDKLTLLVLHLAPVKSGDELILIPLQVLYI